MRSPRPASKARRMAQGPAGSRCSEKLGYAPSRGGGTPPRTQDAKNTVSGPQRVATALISRPPDDSSGRGSALHRGEDGAQVTRKDGPRGEKTAVRSDQQGQTEAAGPEGLREAPGNRAGKPTHPGGCLGQQRPEVWSQGTARPLRPHPVSSPATRRPVCPVCFTNPQTAARPGALPWGKRSTLANSELTAWVSISRHQPICQQSGLRGATPFISPSTALFIFSISRSQALETPLRRASSGQSVPAVTGPSLPPQAQATGFSSRRLLTDHTGHTHAPGQGVCPRRREHGPGHSTVPQSRGLSLAAGDAPGPCPRCSLEALTMPLATGPPAPHSPGWGA
ncbi:Hypothetical predicted protein [Marmota monax]|uniref:Uncharacterized protein n=1 Tax=Marmota monax TaxID=9995 RepID=A0A5E4A360_MARMO|nr:Hypothetical predicted protein [Marmota monax]